MHSKATLGVPMTTATTSWTEWDEPDETPSVRQDPPRLSREEIAAVAAEVDEDMLQKIDHLGHVHAACASAGAAAASSATAPPHCPSQQPQPMAYDWCECGQWFHPYQDTMDRKEITPFFMQLGVEWILELYEAYPKVFTQHVCAVGLSMIQRFLQRPRFHHHFPRHLFQALIAVCLGLAVKIDQDNSGVMSQLHHEMFAEFTLGKLRDLEIIVCQGLDFRLGWHTLLPLSVDEMVARVGNESSQSHETRIRTRQYLTYFLDRSLQYAPEHTGCCKLTVFAACLCLSRLYVRRNKLVTPPTSVNPAPTRPHVLIRIHGAALFQPQTTLMTTDGTGCSVTSDMPSIMSPSHAGSGSCASPPSRSSTPHCPFTPIVHDTPLPLSPSHIPEAAAAQHHYESQPESQHKQPRTVALPPPSPCHKRRRIVDLNSAEWRYYAVL
jgi:hypothetical protein